MAPPYHHSFPSHPHLLPYSSDHHHLFFPAASPQPSSSSSSSTLSFGLALGLDHSHPLDLKQDQGGGIVGCNHDEGTGNDDMETGLRFTIWKQIDKSESSMDNDSALNWASSSSSKIRLVINSSQTEIATPMAIDGGRNFQDLNQLSPSDQTNKRSVLKVDGSSPVIRTCSDCNTTKTPLWRSGPRGPKSLCNACGIRQRKARRAMAEEAANGTTAYGGKSAVLKTTAVQHKIIKPAATLLKRKRGGGGGGRGRKKLRFEEVTISSGLMSESSSSYQRVFPADEREAAILLMALSYGWPSSWLNL